jgi:hypothetical protein
LHVRPKLAHLMKFAGKVTSGTPLASASCAVMQPARNTNQE